MAKSKSTKGATSKDMYVILWSTEMSDDGNMERITHQNGSFEGSSETFASEKEALDYISDRIVTGEYSQGFYSVAKITKTVNTQFTLKEVA